MRKVIFYGGSLLSLVALCFIAAETGASAKRVGFSADMDTVYQVGDHGRFSSHGHYYRSAAGQTREDSGNGAIITDTTNGTVTLLVADRREAHVFNVPANRQPSVDKTKHGPTPYSTDVVEGHPVAKTRVDAGNGRVHEVWTATDLGVPLYSRLQSPGLVTEKSLHNVKAETPIPRCFESPRTSP